MEPSRKYKYLQNSWPLQLFISENVIYMYLEGRKRMPRGAAEIGLPFRHKRVLEIILLQRSYTTELTVVAGVLWWWFVRLWNYFSSSLFPLALAGGHEELWEEFSVLLSETLAMICRLWGTLYRREHACLGIHLQPALGSQSHLNPKRLSMEYNSKTFFNDIFLDMNNWF